MRLLLALLLAINFTFATPFSLQPRRAQRERFFIDPTETVLTVIASQPNCGIEFTKALVIHGVEGGSGHIFQVRNRGTKAVRSYRIATVTSVGTGADWSYRIKESDAPFMPGDVRPKSLETLGIDLVPLSDDLRKKYRLHGPLQGIVVFLVVHVVYADGTEYDGRAEYKALKGFFEKNPVRVQSEQ
jgi:hypothetical protein